MLCMKKVILGVILSLAVVSVALATPPYEDRVYINGQFWKYVESGTDVCAQVNTIPDVAGCQYIEYRDGAHIVYANFNSPEYQDKLHVNGELWRSDVAQGKDVCELVRNTFGSCNYIRFDAENDIHYVETDENVGNDHIYVDGTLWRDDVLSGTNICEMVRNEFGACKYQAFTIGGGQSKHYVSVK